MKSNCQFFVGHICVGNFTFIKLDFRKKSKFSLLLKTNIIFYFKSKDFLLFFAYFCFEVIILMLFLFNILRPFFLIYFFNERFEIV